MQDSIVKVVDIAAPVSRVWQALIDHNEFGQWFGVALDGPFVVGEETTGRITVTGCDHMGWLSRTEAIEPETLIAMSWPTYYDENDPEYENTPYTRCEFRLEPTGGGTRLTITESGFAAIPEPKGEESFRRNSEGWDQQADNIRAHVEA